VQVLDELSTARTASVSDSASSAWSADPAARGERAELER
jgi:hypothetical protein